MIDIKTIQEIYDRHLFLQAYQASLDSWNPSTDLGSLSLEELVFGGRLAARLGGARLSLWLFLHARNRDPRDPMIRYFTMRVRRRGGHFFDLVREFEQEPDLETDDLRIRVSWLAPSRCFGRR